MTARIGIRLIGVLILALSLPLALIAVLASGSVFLAVIYPALGLCLFVFPDPLVRLMLPAHARYCPTCGLRVFDKRTTLCPDCNAELPTDPRTLPQATQEK